MKRNYIDEINQVKSRNGVSGPLLFRFRLFDLKKQFDYLLSNNNTNVNKFELSKYFPIALVASGEFFFRSMTQLLIDKGDPYSKNAGKFNQTQNIKFDFEIVNAIHGKLVSIGEIISHMLSFNNLNDINSNLSIILGKDLISELKIFNKKTKIIEEYNQAVESFQVNHNVILTDIKRLYELRHIFCHEFGNPEITNIDEIYKVFCNSIIFFVICEWYLQNELYPNSPETTAEMINKANVLFEKSQNELNDVIKTIKENSNPDENAKLENFIRKWEQYRDDSSEYQSSLYDFGTMQPLIYMTEKSEITDDFKRTLFKHPNYINKKN